MRILQSPSAIQPAIPPGVGISSTSLIGWA